MADSQRIGCRVLEFSSATERALHRVAEILLPHQEAILDRWVEQQWAAWQPPGLTQADLRQTLGGILDTILQGLHNRRIAQCVADLEQAGAELAARAFPFDALIITVHFLEHSYMPYLLKQSRVELAAWLVGMDQFTHSALVSMANAYFDAYRRELLDQAEVGRLVQECLLAEMPASIDDLDIGHVYASAHERARLGGDFLDSFTPAAGQTAFVVGDLSGHGLPAVSDALMIRSLFKGFMLEAADLADAMGRLNRVLAFYLEPGQFATALGLTYQSDGRLVVVNAGHPPPIVYGGSCTEIDHGGIALGIDPTAEFSSAGAEIKPGETLVVYTDGLMEAGRRGDRYGLTRLTQEIQESRSMPARAVAEHLLDECLRFSGGKLADDVAILVLKRHA